MALDGGSGEAETVVVSDADGAAVRAAWLALPGRTRRAAVRLAVLRGEPYPDPAVAATAGWYASVRLAAPRRKTAEQQRLRGLAKASGEPAASLVIRYRRRRWRLVPALALLAVAIGCYGLSAEAAGPFRLALFSVAFVLIIGSWNLFRHVGVGLPEPAACRISADHVTLLPRTGQPAGVTRMRWYLLAKIVVFEPGSAGAGSGSLIALVKKNYGDFPVRATTHRSGPVRPASWVRATVSSSVLDTSDLDHSADEIVAALTAHAQVPVDRYPMPDPANLPDWPII